MFFVRFIPNAARRRCRHVCVVWCTVTELPVHHIYARTHSWRSSFTTCHFVNIYIPTVHRLYDQHLNKTLSLVYVYICSQVTDATIALAKKEKPIKTLFLCLTDGGILGGIAWLWYSNSFVTNMSEFYFHFSFSPWRRFVFKSKYWAIYLNIYFLFCCFVYFLISLR